MGLRDLFVAKIPTGLPAPDTFEGIKQRLIREAEALAVITLLEQKWNDLVNEARIQTERRVNPDDRRMAAAIYHAKLVKLAKQWDFGDEVIRILDEWKRQMEQVPAAPRPPASSPTQRPNGIPYPNGNVQPVASAPHSDEAVPQLPLSAPDLQRRLQEFRDILESEHFNIGRQTHFGLSRLRITQLQQELSSEANRMGIAKPARNLILMWLMLVSPPSSFVGEPDGTLRWIGGPRSGIKGT